MKRIRIYETGAPEVMVLEEAPDLQVDAGQVLVKVKAIGVNPVDTYLRSGKQGYHPKCSYTPGFDAAGVVEAVGESVKGISLEMRVLRRNFSGAYAEQVKKISNQAASFARSCFFCSGAAVGVPYATAYRALFLSGTCGTRDGYCVTGPAAALAWQRCRLLVQPG